MAEEYVFTPYKDISELKQELEGLKGKKDISTKELYDSVGKLTKTITDMLEIFGAAAEQMKLEEREYEADAKKHEMITSKLDKLLEQNKTIANGMVAIVDMVKEKLAAPAKEREEPPKPKERVSLFRPKPESRLFKPAQPEWQSKQSSMMPDMQPIMQSPMAPPQMPPSRPVIPPDFGMQMPPMQPVPPLDLDFPEESLGLEEEPKKKGLFGMFKK